MKGTEISKGKKFPWYIYIFKILTHVHRCLWMHAWHSFMFCMFAVKKPWFTHWKHNLNMKRDSRAQWKDRVGYGFLHHQSRVYHVSVLKCINIALYGTTSLDGFSKGIKETNNNVCGWLVQHFRVTTYLHTGLSCSYGIQCHKHICMNQWYLYSVLPHRCEIQNIHQHLETKMNPKVKYVL